MDSYTLCLDASIQKCTMCPLHGHLTNQQFGKMLGFGYSGKYLVLGSNPSNRRNVFGGYAMSKNESSTSNSEDYLWRCLEELNWPIKDTYLTNVAKCSTPDNRELSSIEFTTCGKIWLAQEMMMIIPQVVICLGNSAYNNFEEIGFWFYENLKVFKVFHHAYIARTPSKYEEWKLQWAGILQETSQ